MSDTQMAFGTQPLSKPDGGVAPQTEGTITFRASRLKLLPAPILASLMIPVPFIMLARVWQIGHPPHPAAGTYPAVVLLLVLALSGVGVEIRLVLDVLFPERIVLDTSGWTRISPGGKTHYDWSDFLDVREARVPTGRSSQRCISLAPKKGGKPVIIMAGAYLHSLDTMLRTIKQAQVGKLVDPGGETFPWPHALIGIPLSLLSVCSIVMLIGPRLGMRPFA